MQDSYIDDSGGYSGLGGHIERALRWGGAAISAALIVSIVIWAYKLGVRDVREVPVIRAMEGPARTQPADPGGAQADHQGLEVNGVLAGNPDQAPSAIALAPQGTGLTNEDVAGLTVPQPETPVEPLEEGLTSSSVVSDDLIVPDFDDQPPPPPGSSQPAPQVELVPGTEVVAQPEAAPVIEVEPEPVDITALVEAVQAEAQTSSGPLTATPSVRPRIRPSNLNTSVTLGPTETPVASRAEVPPGTRVVQLGAYDTPEDAEAEWARLVGTHADLLISKARYIEQATNAGRTFYRLRAVGFETSNESKAMCDALQARGEACIPVTQR